MSDLNEQISLINKINQLELQIEQILKYSEEAIISINSDHNIILFNKGAGEIFNYTEDEVLGKHLNILIPEKFHVVHEKHIAEFSAYKIHSKAIGRKVPVTGLRKGGKEFYAEASISVLTFDSTKVFTVFLRDITKIVELEKELKVSREKFEAIVKIANDAIISVDHDLKITLFNNGAEAIFGYSEKELIGKQLNILMPESSREQHDRHMIEFASFPNTSRMMGERQEIVGLRKDGVEFHAEASIANVNINGNANYTVILRDVSSRKLLERQLIKYLNELERLDSEKGRYFTILAHDLRNPFGNLLGYIEYIIDSLDDLDKKDILDLLKASSSSAKNIFNLLESLLDWTRLQMNRISCSPVLFNAREKIDSAIQLYKVASENKKIVIENNVKENCKLYADPDMFYTIIRNVIANAIKYSFENGKVTIECTENNRLVTLTIRDSGIGMSRETLSKLFRTDRKEENTFGTKGESGFGIGLLLVKDFVEINRGQLRIESKPDIGSSISITLPAVKHF